MFKDFNFKFKLKYINYTYIILIMALAVIGVVVIGSAVPGANYQSRQIMGLAIGTVLMLVIMIIDYKWLLKFHWFYYILCIGMLLAVLKLGDTHKGAMRWIEIAGISFQPSEFAKILTIIFFAWYFGHDQKMITKWRYFFISVALMGIILILVVKEPDLSTTILLTILFVITLFISGFSYKKIGIVILSIAPIVAAVIAYIMIVPPTEEDNQNKLLKYYQYKRIMAFINPDEYDDDRYQQDNSVMAIGSGKLNGKGLYNDDPESVKNGNYIAEPQTDFIIAIVGEELGFVGCITIIILLFLIAIYSCIIGARAPDMQGRLICFGFAAIIVFQTFINIGVATEILPNTGIPLPFVSYGLSSLVAMFSGAGFVLNVSFRKKAFMEEVKNEHRLDSPRL